MASTSLRMARRNAANLTLNHPEGCSPLGKLGFKFSDLLNETGLRRVWVENALGEIAPKLADQGRPMARDGPMAFAHVLGDALGAADALGEHLGRDGPQVCSQSPRQNLPIIRHEKIAPVGH